MVKGHYLPVLYSTIQHSQQRPVTRPLLTSLGGDHLNLIMANKVPSIAAIAAQISMKRTTPLFAAWGANTCVSVLDVRPDMDLPNPKKKRPTTKIPMISEISIRGPRGDPEIRKTNKPNRIKAEPIIIMRLPSIDSSLKLPLRESSGNSFNAIVNSEGGNAQL